MTMVLTMMVTATRTSTDSNCANDPACSGGSSENCLTLGDEDGDGDADCLDTTVMVHQAMTHLET